MGLCRLLKTVFAQFLGKYRVVSALFGKIERLTFTGTFDAFQHLVKSHSFKQICFPHRSEMGGGGVEELPQALWGPEKRHDLAVAFPTLFHRAEDFLPHCKFTLVLQLQQLPAESFIALLRGGSLLAREHESGTFFLAKWNDRRSSWNGSYPMNSRKTERLSRQSGTLLSQTGTLP